MKNVRARKFRCFTLFVLALSAVTQAQDFSVVYLFSPSTVAVTPSKPGIIAQGRDGNLYSTAFGGTIFNVSGTVFEVVPPNAMSVKLAFNGADGNDPFGGLTLGTDGNFYGATEYGGAHSWGTVYKITPGGSPETVLYSFTGAPPDGGVPLASPIQGTDGNFYGTTDSGGINGLGSVYKITPSGTFTTLYSFDGGYGEHLLAPLVQGTEGLFYGVTFDGGDTTNYGTVFKISSAGHLTVLHNFKSGADPAHPDGANPVGGLTQGLDGNFYGTTERGGGTTCSRGGCGTVFKITPSGVLTTLYSFQGKDDQEYPDGGLVQDKDGNLYGTTLGDPVVPSCGTIFRITPAGAGTFSTLYTFPLDNTTGCHPEVTLLQRTTGVLYGDTVAGGLGFGVFYSLDLGLPPFVSILPPLSVAKVGKTIQILGQGFLGTSSVSFNGTQANFGPVVSDTYLTAVVPNGATTGFVSVTTPAGTLTSNKKFRVTPQVKSFTPISGSVGTSLTITGVSLTQTTKVMIGGVKATFTVLNDSTVTATVPAGAVTGKKITITTLGGSASSPTVFAVI